MSPLQVADAEAQRHDAPRSKMVAIDERAEGPRSGVAWMPEAVDEGSSGGVLHEGREGQYHGSPCDDDRKRTDPAPGKERARNPERQGDREERDRGVHGIR